MKRARVMAMVAEGLTPTEIAERLGISRQRVHQIANPARHSARALVRYAVLTGHIHRPGTCPLCGGAGRIEAHHHDYSRPLDVEWMCSACHGVRHSAWARFAPRGQGGFAREVAERGLPTEGVA